MEKLWAAILAEVIHADGAVPATLAGPQNSALAPAHEKGEQARPRRQVTAKTRLTPAIIAEMSRGAMPPDGLFREMLRRASVAQQYRMKWRTLKYSVVEEGLFTTLTANLECLPWILLDLRGRMQPLLLRIGVGVGEMDGHIQEPASRLKGEAVRLARHALEESRGARTFGEAARARQMAAFRGMSRHVAAYAALRSLPLSGELPLSDESPSASPKTAQNRATFQNPCLTRFCTVNSDFDETVNAIYSSQDALALEIEPSQWKTLQVSPGGFPTPVEAYAAPNGNASPAMHSANGHKNPASVREQSTNESGKSGGAERISAPMRAAGTGRNGSFTTVTSRIRNKRNAQRAYYGELFATASGVEQLIAERFYVALHDYEE